MSTAIVDLNAIAANLRVVRSLVGPETMIMPAVKADAYGHGAVATARAMLAAGADRLAVATPQEVMELRAAGIEADILLLTPPLDRLDELAEARTIFTVADEATAARLDRARLPSATRVHLKVDTGLGRLGRPPAEAAALARTVGANPRLELEGVWTHFAAAEDDPVLTGAQLEAFLTALELMAADGIEPPIRHAANSAAIIRHPEAYFDAVRPGIMSYGYPPEPGVGDDLGLRPALTLVAPVTFVKRVAAGTGVSYNHLWRAERDTNVATVRCGYADGYRRLLTGRSWASIRGTRVPVCGRVAMDQVMFDVGDLDVKPGELMTLLGGPGPSAAELGAMAESNAYDMLTSLTRRVARQYVRGSEATAPARSA